MLVQIPLLNSSYRERARFDPSVAIVYIMFNVSFDTLQSSVFPSESDDLLFPLLGKLGFVYTQKKNCIQLIHIHTVQVMRQYYDYHDDH